MRPLHPEGSQEQGSPAEAQPEVVEDQGQCDGPELHPLPADQPPILEEPPQSVEADRELLTDGLGSGHGLSPQGELIPGGWRWGGNRSRPKRKREITLS